MPSVTFRLTPVLHERFMRYCEDKDVRASDVLREAIEKFMDRVDEPPLGSMTLLNGATISPARKPMLAKPVSAPTARPFKSRLKGEWKAP